MKDPLFSPILEEYLEEHTSPESELLSELNRETHAKVLSPRMLSGHTQGRFLSMVSHMIRPQNILEIGTYTGYAAICLAEGLAEGGSLHTIEVNLERETLIRKFISKSNLESIIKLYLGNALEIIPTIDILFDLVFIDADKKNNLVYYEMVLPKLSPNGFILIDNVLWSGKVLHNPSKKDTKTNYMQTFNDFIQQDTRVENILLPLRDGLMLVRKK
jgi:predicted O-methyltransferase YrrM